jgi:flagellar hook-associated protein 1 FlgK
MTSLLSIGKTGLMAAQTNLAIAGHNIANANVPGYSRQGSIQSTSVPQSTSGGYIGTGTEVTSIRRFYDNFLGRQVLNVEANKSSLDAYYSQIKQIDNVLTDSDSGLAPALQDFFKGVQDANSNPSSVASRQSMLSAANSLAGRFQSLGAQLRELGDGVNSQITSSVTQINTYAQEIAKLNVQIAGLSGNPAQLPNDLLDQRDAVISELNKLVKVNVTPSDNNGLSVSVGTGQPLVVNGQSFQLGLSSSPTDPSRVTVGFQIGGKISPLPDGTLTGGALGGLLSFRSDTLDAAQNALGQIAAGLATSFNDQHKLGQDLSDTLGKNFFGDMKATVGVDSRNSPASTASVSAVVTDATKLTTSDYDVNYDGTNFFVTRKSDGQKTTINPFPQVTPQVIDGVAYSISGAPQPDDHFLVRPTANAANDFHVELTDPNKIALAVPVVTDAPKSNKGSGAISLGTVDANYPGSPLAAPVTLTFNGGNLSGFPAAQPVTVVSGGVTTVYPAGTPNIPYTDGMAISFGGVHVTMSGTPAANDTYTIKPNSNGVGDNHNGLLLAGLQSTKILNGGNATYQSGYAQLTSTIGNKTREVQISALSSESALEQATNAQQSVSGVNLDEEAADLLRFQQAYQASGKVMQIAGQMFDVLLTLGN